MTQFIYTYLNNFARNTWYHIMGNKQTLMLKDEKIPVLGPGGGDISYKMRKRVWKQWCQIGRCFCCDVIIHETGWHCGHILPKSLGGTPHLHNLRPLCSTCNLKMGNTHMYDYIIRHKLPGRRHIRKSPLYDFFKQKHLIIQKCQQQISELNVTKKISNILHKRLLSNRWMEAVELIRTYHNDG